MRVREPLNVTILNQTEVKYYELLVVLFGNPFIDTMESKKKKKKCLLYPRRRKYFIFDYCSCMIIGVFFSSKADQQAGKNVGSIHKTTIPLNRQVLLCTSSFIMTAAGFIGTMIIQC